MPEIKTKKTVHDVKVFDRSAVAAEHMKKAAIRAKDTAQNLMDDSQVTPDEYAEDRLRYAAQDAATDTGRQMKRSAEKAREKLGTRKNKAQAGARDPVSRSEQKSAQTAPDGKGLHRRQHSIKRAGAEKSAIKKTAEPSAKLSRFGSNMGAGRPVKTAQNVGRVTIKSSKNAALRAEKAAKATRNSAKATAAMAKKAAASSHRIAIAIKQAIVKMVQAIIAAIRNLIVMISAGGGLAGIVIVVICLIGLIVGSSFGIFFSSETENDDGPTMRQVIQKINEEYQGKLETIKAENPHDVLEMSGSRAVWPEVLSVYSVKTTTDPDEPQEVATMTEEKKQILTDIFWQMNEIAFQTETTTETIIAETDDGEGNIVETEQTEEKTKLHITVSHKTAEEMAELLGFSVQQKAQLKELLDVDNSMWMSVLYGIYGSDDMIVQIAMSQIGCAGGETFWSWYGFGSRVEWCGCFVSWCADQCGYIDSGIIPKYAGCPNGVEWFQARGQWADNSIEPSPGMIIFFDWDNLGDSGPQDGEADHTGIVVRVENGTVYTVEGNCNETCQALQYPVGHYQILGYGIPAY